MKKNYKITFADGLPDIIHTFEKADEVLVFSSFRVCKAECIKVIKAEIKLTQTLTKKLKRREVDVLRIRLNNFTIEYDKNLSLADDSTDNVWTRKNED